MRAVLHNVSQRSDEWRRLRLGRVTSSAAADMLATTKSGMESAGRRHLRTRLVLERITGESHDSTYENDAMRRGRELEPQAIAAYEAMNGSVVSAVGFYTHQSLMAGTSPDGLVNGEGILEVKVPLAATHLETLKSTHVPDAYLKQILHHLYITEAPWCDYVSWEPSFPPELQLFQLRIERASLDVKAYDVLLRRFLKEVMDELAVVEHLRSRACPPSPSTAQAN